MTFSVVIAAYNAADTLGEAIESVLAQTFQDFEVIVVDDGSTDATAAVAARYTSDPRVRVYSQQNAGVAAARNRGIRAAAGVYVSMLDSDDLWMPNYLAEFALALERDPKVGIAFTDSWVLDTVHDRFRAKSSSSHAVPTRPHEQFVEALLRHNFLHNSATVRRAVLEDVGGYDPMLTHGEDWELWLRVAIRGTRAVKVPGGPHAIWRDRPDSATANVAAMARAPREVYEAVLRRNPPPNVRELTEQLLQGIDRRARLHARPALRVRRLLANLTRPLRVRYLPSNSWRLRPEPPPDVARAFPGLGTGANAVRVRPSAASPTVEREHGRDGALDETEDASPPAGLSRIVARGVSISGAGYVFAQVLTFVAYLALAKLLSPADFGHFAAGTALLTVGFLVGESGLIGALIQRRTRLEEALNSAFIALLAGGMILTLLSLASAPLVALFFNSHEAGTVAAVMSGWMFLRVSGIVPDAILQRRFSFARRVIVDPLSTAAFAAGAIPAAAAGWGVWSLVIGTYASATVNVLAPWAFAGWRPRPRLASIEVWRELARFGRPVLGANIIRRVVTEIPVLVLGRLHGPATLGQFTYASRVASQPLGAIIGVGGYVLQPAFARLSAHDARFRSAVLRAFRWSCITSFPVGMMLVPLATPAVVLVFGHKWHEAGVGAAALGGYCAALAVDSIASESWKSCARTDMLPRMHGLSLLLTAICVGALAPFGLLGVTLGMSVSAIGVAAYAVRGMSSVIGIALRDLVAALWPAALAASAMAGSVLCLDRFVVHSAAHGVLAGLALIVAESIVGVAFYTALLSLIEPDFRHQFAAGTRRLLGLAGRARSTSAVGV